MVTNNLTGLSTDTKPYAEKESLFLELDTGNWYYCTGGNAWTKVEGLSGVKVDNALIGKSTDGKPNASENTIFIEVDTGKTYYCNGSSWAEIASGGGGGFKESTITFINTSGSALYPEVALTGRNGDQYGLYKGNNAYYGSGDTLTAGPGTSEIQVLIISDHGIEFFITNDSTYIITDYSGDVTSDEYTIYVHGDCTITLSGDGK